MSIKHAGLQQIIGKTIRAVVVSANRQCEPAYQLFLVFDDDTHFELYGAQLHSGSQLYNGGEQAVLGYVQSSGGVITRIN